MFLINTREKQELPGVELGTSGLLAFGCHTEPSTPDYIYKQPVWLSWLMRQTYKQ